ncbi:MAG TPA: Fur family transcriptional regulator [Patescibacteria group bacterium]|nr:Fur family transcriptional regulator [Patescibacteria group bacterium]
MHSFDKTIQKLRQEGFKLTPQRLAVIKHMIGNSRHPSALAIHKDLKRRYPSLSFSTVYNTLNMLERIEEVQSLNVIDGHLNYDPDISTHGHFLCTKCGTIHDIRFEDCDDIKLPQGEIGGHTISSIQVSFKGTCRICR